MISVSLLALMKNRSFLIAMLLAMCDSAISTVSSIYGYSIILSTYPSQWLIYYIVLQTLCTSFVRRAGLLFLTKDHKKSVLTQYIFFILIALISVTLMYSGLRNKIYVLPFIICIATSGIASLASILCWSLLSMAFGMREYKTVAKYANQAAFASSIVSSFIIPLLVAFFSNQSLLIFTCIMFISCYVLITQISLLQEVPSPQKARIKTKAEPTKYPLYRYMMIFSILTATIIGVSQYIMRIESSIYFTHEQLSAFFGYFSGVTNILGLLVATTTGRMLKRFGLISLLYSIPFVSFLISISIIFSPTFWGIILLGSTRNILNYSYIAYANEVTLNILPPSVRFITKANIKSTANIASMLLLLVFTLGKTNINHIIYWIPILSCATIFYARKVKTYYKITLQQESAFRRYNILSEINVTNTPIFNEMAIKLIQSKDNYSILYALDLVKKLPFVELPQELYSLLEYPDREIRNAVIDFIIEKNSPSSLPYLISQRQKETDFSIKFKLLEEIARQDLGLALELTQEDPDKILHRTIEYLLLLKNPIEKNKGIEQLMQLRQAPEPHIRQMLASLIGTFKITDLMETLGVLISDANNDVSNQALNSTAKMKMIKLIPQITAELINRKIYYGPQNILISLGPQGLPYLLSQEYTPKTRKILTKTVAAIPGREAEDALLSIIEKGDVYCRNIVAKYANERACVFAVSDEFKMEASRLATEECAIIFSLRNALIQHPNDPVHLEIQLRIELAKIRFLQWVAIATRPRQINKLIASLLQPNSTNSQQVLDKAIELLEIYIKDKKIRSYVSYILEDTALNVRLTPPNTYRDLWLEQIMDNQLNEDVKNTPLLSLVFELRAVRLFKDLPAEILLELSKEAQYCTFNAGELIFAKNDAADGLYCVSHGEVTILRDQKQVTTITEHGFFGELALLDESYRVASAVANTDCSLIFIEKDVFNRIADDVPDVLRTVLRVILEYLRKNLEQSS